MKIISFGTLSLENSFPFIVSVLYVTRNFFILQIINNDNKQWINAPWFFTLLLFIGEALNGFLDLLSHFLIKHSRYKTIEANSNIKQIKVFSYLPAKPIYQSNWVKGLFLYISSLLEGISMTTVFIVADLFIGKNDFSFQMRIFNLFFIVILSYFFLSYGIYLHQKVSCIIVAIGIVLFQLSKILNKEIDRNWNQLLIYFSIYLATYFIHSIREVFQKWLMENQHIKPVRIPFIEGIFGIINSIIGIVIYDACVQSEHMTLLDCLSKLTKSNTYTCLFFVGYILCCFGYGFFSIYTKYWFNPTMMGIAYSFTIILWEGVLRIKNNNTTNGSLWYLVPSYLLLMIGCLVYNEIIIINVCKMSFNTKQEICKRANKEITTDLLYSQSFDGPYDLE